MSLKAWGTRALGGIADAYGDANFRRYSVGSVVSWLSFFVQSVAVAWTAWNLTHSTGWLSAVALLDAVPMSVLAPFGGVLADRFDRFRVLMVAYGFAMLQSALLAVLAFSGTLTVERLAILTLMHGVIHAFSVPAQFGLLPRFVDRGRLPSAIAVASAYSSLGFFVGPALAGWVIERFGVGTAFASNVAGYGIFFWSAALLVTPAGHAPPRPSARSFGADLLDGVRTIAAHRGFTALLGLMTFGDGLAGALRQMLPALADRDLRAGVGGYATLLAAAGVGATAAALWLAQGGARRATSDGVAWAFGGYLLGTVAVLSLHRLAPAALAMAARGFCFEICRTGTVALLQLHTQDASRGRLMSAQFLLRQGASAAGVAIIGALATGWGLRPSLLVACGVAALAWIAFIRRRSRIAASFAV